jgi:integrase
MSTALVLEIPKLRPGKTEVKKKRNPRGIFEKIPGSGIWWIRYTDAHRRLRRERAPSKSAAIDLYRKRKTEALQGQKLPETLRRGRVSFKEIAADAIEDIKRRYRRPAPDVMRLRVAAQWFGSREAASLTPGEIDARLSAAAAQFHWSASTVNHHRTVLSLAFRIAKRDRRVDINPVRDVPHRRENNNRVRSLTSEEEGRLREVIRKSYPLHENEFDFALQTGLRQGNQYDLEWNMVNMQARTLHFERTKNEQMLTVPLNEPALNVLRRLRTGSSGEGRVFISEETGRPLNNPKHWFPKALRKAKVLNFHWHDLRHSFATRLRQNGVALEDIADLLGHKGLSMSRRYAHADMGRLHEAVSRLSRTSTDTTTDTAQKGSVAISAIPCPKGFSIQ